MDSGLLHQDNTTGWTEESAVHMLLTVGGPRTWPACGTWWENPGGLCLLSNHWNVTVHFDSLFFHPQARWLVRDCLSALLWKRRSGENNACDIRLPSALSFDLVLLRGAAWDYVPTPLKHNSFLAERAQQMKHGLQTWSAEGRMLVFNFKPGWRFASFTFNSILWWKREK